MKVDHKYSDGIRVFSGQASIVPHNDKMNGDIAVRQDTPYNIFIFSKAYSYALIATYATGWPLPGFESLL